MNGTVLTLTFPQASPCVVLRVLRASVVKTAVAPLRSIRVHPRLLPPFTAQHPYHQGTKDGAHRVNGNASILPLWPLLVSWWLSRCRCRAVRRGGKYSIGRKAVSLDMFYRKNVKSLGAEDVVVLKVLARQ